MEKGRKKEQNGQNISLGIIQTGIAENHLGST
jgi:hypothetical protein